MDESPLGEVRPLAHQRSDCRRYVNEIGVLFAAVLGFCTALAAPQRLTAAPEPAHFWISTSNTGPQGPQAPTIYSGNGDLLQFYIWAQPATDATGAFRRLENFSLNLKTFQSQVTFANATVDVYKELNPSNPTIHRFEYENDSSSDPPLMLTTESDRSAGKAYPIREMDGFSVYGDQGLGIGPDCTQQNLCVLTPPSGPTSKPAWLIAAVSLQTVQVTGPIQLYLQIGYTGINHWDTANGTLESSSLTSVVLGAASTAEYTAPVYIAGGYSGHSCGATTCGDRETTVLTGQTPDSPDLVILPVVQSLDGDFNGDGKVDAADYVVWRKSGGTSTDYNKWRSNFVILPAVQSLDGDFNGDGKVDAADYVVWRKSGGTSTDYNKWRSNFGRLSGNGAATGELNSSVVVPEPATLVLVLLSAWMFGACRRIPGFLDSHRMPETRVS